MTPTVQFQVANIKARVWSLFMIYNVIGLLIVIFTGFWPVMFFIFMLVVLEVLRAQEQVAFLFRLESGLILEIRQLGYDKTRISIAKFEQEAEDETNRLEQFRKKRFADLIRNILTDIHKQMEQNELGQN